MEREYGGLGNPEEEHGGRAGEQERNGAAGEGGSESTDPGFATFGSSKQDAAETARMEALGISEALDELDAMVDKLMHSDFPLEEALREYERGLKLLDICEKKVGRIEKQIKILGQEYGGKDGEDEEAEEEEDIQ